MGKAGTGAGDAKTEGTEEEFVLYECNDQIATITLNRPAKLNAVSDDLARQLFATVRRFDLDDEARVALLVGNGRAFCSGADVHQRQMRPREDYKKLGGSAAAHGTHGHELLTKAVNWKPVIAVAHGYAMGFGLGMCLNSDMIVAEEGTKFQVTETPRGLAGSRYYALMHFRGGASLAVDAALTGRFFTAEEAHAAGIVDRLAPQGQGRAVALELAKQIAANPPLGVRATVRTRRWFMEKLEAEVHLYSRALNLTLTDDFAESARAFVEKRKAAPTKGR